MVVSESFINILDIVILVCFVFLVFFGYRRVFCRSCLVFLEVCCFYICHGSLVGCWLKILPSFRINMLLFYEVYWQIFSIFMQIGFSCF